MIIGVNRDAIQRNIILEMCALLHVPAPTPKTTQLNILGRTIFFVGANDERAQKRIQGSTLALAYVDEITNIPQGFWQMLLSRLSVPGAQLFGTTNPDSPFHWLKENYLNRDDLDLKSWQFRLEDNPSLEEHYVESLKKEYSGLWYKRYIEGQWVLAEGCVYDGFDEKYHVIEAPPSQAKYFIVGVDYGTTNPTVFNLIGINTSVYPNYWLEVEHFYDSKKAGRQKTDTEHAEDLKRFIADRNVQTIYMDPSAASFKLECMRQGINQIHDAENSVIDGIRFTAQLIANGDFKVCRGCSNTIREFGSYVWDSKWSEKGEDKPIKAFDHSLDAIRYALFTHLGLGGRLVAPEELNEIYAKARGLDNGMPAFFQDGGQQAYIGY
jgi:PBSX family phage terminase large subunit